MSRLVLSVMAAFWAMCLVSSALLSFAFSIAPLTMTHFLMNLI